MYTLLGFNLKLLERFTMCTMFKSPLTLWRRSDSNRGTSVCERKTLDNDLILSYFTSCQCPFLDMTLKKIILALFGTRWVTRDYILWLEKS